MLHIPFFHPNRTTFVQTKITLASVFQSDSPGAADYTQVLFRIAVRAEPIFIFGRASIIRSGLCYKKNGVIS